MSAEVDFFEINITDEQWVQKINRKPCILALGHCSHHLSICRIPDVVVIHALKIWNNGFLDKPEDLK